MRLKWMAFFFILCSLSPALANLRFAAGGGLGNTQTKNEISEAEGPFTILFTVDYVYSSKNMIGFEHLRSLSLSPASTSISFTGVYWSYYLNDIPTPYMSVDRLNSEDIIYRNIGYFVGAGLGLGQSNNLPDASGKTSNAAGFYLSPRAGADLQLTKNLGARGEVVMATTLMGTGNLSSFSMIGSLYFGF